MGSDGCGSVPVSMGDFLYLEDRWKGLGRATDRGSVETRTGWQTGKLTTPRSTISGLGPVRQYRTYVRYWEKEMLRVDPWYRVGQDYGLLSDVRVRHLRGEWVLFLNLFLSYNPSSIRQCLVGGRCQEFFGHEVGDLLRTVRELSSTRNCIREGRRNLRSRGGGLFVGGEEWDRRTLWGWVGSSGSSLTQKREGLEVVLIHLKPPTRRRKVWLG